jgi:hypothetical protein
MALSTAVFAKKAGKDLYPLILQQLDKTACPSLFKP